MDQRVRGTEGTQALTRLQRTDAAPTCPLAAARLGQAGGVTVGTRGSDRQLPTLIPKSTGAGRKGSNEIMLMDKYK